MYHVIKFLNKSSVAVLANCISRLQPSWPPASVTPMGVLNAWHALLFQNSMVQQTSFVPQLFNFKGYWWQLKREHYPHTTKTIKTRSKQWEQTYCSNHITPVVSSIQYEIISHFKYSTIQIIKIFGMWWVNLKQVLLDTPLLHFYVLLIENNSNLYSWSMETWGINTSKECWALFGCMHTMFWFLCTNNYQNKIWDFFKPW